MKLFNLKVTIQDTAELEYINITEIKLNKQLLFYKKEQDKAKAARCHLNVEHTNNTRDYIKGIKILIERV